MRACLLYNLQCKCAIVAHLSCRMPGKLAFGIMKMQGNQILHHLKVCLG